MSERVKIRVSVRYFNLRHSIVCIYIWSDHYCYLLFRNGMFPFRWKHNKVPRIKRRVCVPYIICIRLCTMYCIYKYINGVFKLIVQKMPFFIVFLSYYVTHIAACGNVASSTEAFSLFSPFFHHHRLLLLLLHYPLFWMLFCVWFAQCVIWFTVLFCRPFTVCVVYSEFVPFFYVSAELEIGT